MSTKTRSFYNPKTLFSDFDLTKKSSNQQEFHNDKREFAKIDESPSASSHSNSLTKNFLIQKKLRVLDQREEQKKSLGCYITEKNKKKNTDFCKRGDEAYCGKPDHDNFFQLRVFARDKMKLWVFQLVIAREDIFFLTWFFLFSYVVF